MNKTSYHKRLEAVRHKILGEALALVTAGSELPSPSNHEEIMAECRKEQDPSRFKRLEAICSDSKVKKRLELLTQLYGLESKTEKTPFDVWLAMLWSGQARIPSPLWAVRRFETFGDGRLFDDDVQSLDKAFGFRSGRGKTSELVQRARDIQYDALCREVWALTLLDLKVAPACRMVARRFQQQHVTLYIHDLREVKRVQTFTEHLRQRYYRWRKANDAFNLRTEPSCRAWLATHRNEYLKRFPSE